MPTTARKSAYILKSNGDPIFFDVITQETHSLKNDITEHPVEEGANVTDHVRALLDELQLEVFVTNAPIDNRDRFAFGSTVGDVRALDLAPAAFQGLGGDADPRLANSAASVLQFENPVNNVSETYRALRKLRDDAELVQVLTPLWDYTDLLIKEVSIPRTAQDGDGAKITISFKQIRLVETKKVPSPIPAEVRGNGSKDKGAKGTKDAEPAAQKESLAHAALEAVKGFFS